MATNSRKLRRGLPRFSGGESWPPRGGLPAKQNESFINVSETLVASHLDSTEAGQTSVEADVLTLSALHTGDQKWIRRGLPRTQNGSSWPPPTPLNQQADNGAIKRLPLAASTAPRPQESEPSPATSELSPQSSSIPTESLIGSSSRRRWLWRIAIASLAGLTTAALVVLTAQTLLTLQVTKNFLATYPGEYILPSGAPEGLPAWLGWQHFFNVLLMLMIIRSGLHVRREKRPRILWNPRNRPARKISLALWFHQSLDILWLANGVVFIVLLFATGQWMKIVPTSWEVFPNAISAMLQYASLHWPTENGWVNYNSVQQLSYFVTVFVAAPLAAISGARMSTLWPKSSSFLNKIYPLEWARMVHFPVMIYFVGFISVHVMLVMSTGALRNLNHMYASQDAVNWVGFTVFAVSLGFITLCWNLARDSILVHVAKFFGTLSRG